MAGDIEQLLRDATELPTRPVASARLVRRARRERLLARAGMAVASLAVIVAAVVALPSAGDGDGVPLVTDRPDGVTHVPQPEARQSADELWDRTYEAVAVVTEGDDPRLLDGTRIQLGLARDIPVTKLEGQPAIISDADGYATWHSGCNRRAREVTVAGGKFEFGGYGPSTTHMLCSPEEMAQDRWVDEFFAASPSWQLDGDVLELATSEMVIRFELVDDGDGFARG